MNNISHFFEGIDLTFAVFLYRVGNICFFGLTLNAIIMKNFFITVGFHCVILGMFAIIAVIALGFITCCANLPGSFFYIGLGAVLFFGTIGTIFCMKCNCSNLNKKKNSAT